jgi:protein tyrosine phosphatase (PTP) superfamily phosphohydrolase (DUF442 family)
MRDIKALHDEGITSVLNVQSLYDFKHRSIDFDQIKKYYEELGIKLVHKPIYDFNTHDLTKKLQKAVDIFKEMYEAGKHSLISYHFHQFIHN